VEREDHGDLDHGDSGDGADGSHDGTAERTRPGHATSTKTSRLVTLTVTKTGIIDSAVTQIAQPSGYDPKGREFESPGATLP